MKTKDGLAKMKSRKNTNASTPKQPVKIRLSQHAMTPADACLAEAFGAWARGRSSKGSTKREGLAVQRKLRAEWDK